MKNQTKEAIYVVEYRVASGKWKPVYMYGSIVCSTDRHQAGLKVYEVMARPEVCNVKSLRHTSYRVVEYKNVADTKVEFAEEMASKLACHSDYHGDNVVSAMYALAQGKEVGQVKVLDLDKTRKETAKDILKKISSFAYDTFKEFGVFDETDLVHILDELAEKYGADVR